MCKTITFFVFLFLIISSYCFATDYYVDKTNGSPNGTGLSEQAAWKSFADFDINQLNSNSTIHVKAGTYSAKNSAYNDAIIDINNNHDITIMADEAGVIFDATNFYYGVIVHNSAYNITITDIKFQNYVKNGVNVSGTSSGGYISGVNVENCQFEYPAGYTTDQLKSSAAIFFQYVENSEIKNCNINAVKNTSAQTDGIFIQAGNNIDIFDNEVFLQNNYSAPEGSQPHVDCIQVTYFSNGAHSQNINIERNKLTNNSTIAYNNTAIYADRQGLDANDVEDTLRIINNTIVSAQGWNLINVHFTSTTDKVDILNNTLVGKGNNPHLLNVYKVSGSVSVLNIKNNIFYKEGASVNNNLNAIKFNEINLT